MSNNKTSRQRVLIVGELNGWGGWIDIPLENYTQVIFMGNLSSYDPKKYGINEICKNIAKLLAYKKANSDKVRLLVGPEDLAYMYPQIASHELNGYPPAVNMMFSNMIGQRFNKGLFDYCWQINNFICVYGGFSWDWLDYHLESLFNAGLGTTRTRFGKLVNRIWRMPHIRDIFVEDEELLKQYAYHDPYNVIAGPMFVNWLHNYDDNIGFNQVTSNAHCQKIVVDGKVEENDAIIYTNCIDHNLTFAKQPQNFLTLTAT